MCGFIIVSLWIFVLVWLLTLVLVYICSSDAPPKRETNNNKVEFKGRPNQLGKAPIRVHSAQDLVTDGSQGQTVSNAKLTQIQTETLSPKHLDSKILTPNSNSTQNTQMFAKKQNPN